jgi:hypothetical protein
MPFNEAGLPREVAQFVSPVSPMTDDEAVAAGRERERESTSGNHQAPSNFGTFRFYPLIRSMEEKEDPTCLVKLKFSFATI